MMINDDKLGAKTLILAAVSCTFVVSSFLPRNNIIMAPAQHKPKVTEERREQLRVAAQAYYQR